MRKQFFSYLFCLYLLFPVPAEATRPFRILFWNVENLFDCYKDSLKNDNEFLPSSIRRWHYGRYKKNYTG